MPLGEFVTLKRGYDLPSPRRVDGPVPVVSSSGVTGCHDVSKVEGPGVVTGRYGTLGKVFFIDEDFWPLNTALYVRDFQGNDPRFSAYFLQSILTNTDSNKAAVPGLNRNDLHALTVRTTRDLEEQRAIASILHVYDDLIENNLRRIQLLEQTGRLIYKEWFVRLRFPGCGHVAITNGTPTGWRRRTIGEICPLRYGKALRKEDRHSGPYPVFGSSGVLSTHDTGIIKGPGIVIGRKGSIGSVFWSEGDFWPIDTVYYIDSGHSTIYLYYALLYAQFVNTDVAVPGLNRNFAHSREILIPDDNTYVLFEQQMLVRHRQIDQLARQNRALARARDLLLPRLINGELEP